LAAGAAMPRSNKIPSKIPVLRELRRKQPS
jgi:hypothetical protein